MPNLDIVSADDHIIEPPDLWTKRLPKKYRDVGPRVVTEVVNADSVPVAFRSQATPRNVEIETWAYEGLRVPNTGLGVSASFARERYTNAPVTYEQMIPGCYDPVARVKDMDRDGVLASLCFPTFSRLCGQTFAEADDPVLARLCIAAYNDWNIEEWAHAAPGRLIPMSILPLWDAALAVEEVQRVAARGVRAISFTEDPRALGLPSIHDADRYWDPVIAAIVDAGLVLCLHIGSSSKMVFYEGEVPDPVWIGLAPLNAQIAVFNWCFSELLDRFPTLEIVMSEGGIGWIPYVLERMDYTFEHQGAWTQVSDRLSRKPSEVFRQQFYGCFIDDQWGARHVVDYLGADRCLLEVDYPHSDTSWPNSQAIASEHLNSLSEVDRQLVARANAEQLFRFQASAVGSL